MIIKTKRNHDYHTASESVNSYTVKNIIIFTTTKNEHKMVDKY